MAFRGDGRTVVVLRNPYATQRTLRLDVGGRRWSVVVPAESLNTVVLPG